MPLPGHRLLEQRAKQQTDEADRDKADSQAENLRQSRHRHAGSYVVARRKPTGKVTTIGLRVTGARQVLSLHAR